MYGFFDARHYAHLPGSIREDGSGSYDVRAIVGPEDSDQVEQLQVEVAAEWAAAHGQFWAFVTQEIGGDRRFVVDVIQYSGMRVDLQMFDYLFDAIRFAQVDVNKRAQEYLEAASVDTLRELHKRARNYAKHGSKVDRIVYVGAKADLERRLRLKGPGL